MRCNMVVLVEYKMYDPDVLYDIIAMKSTCVFRWNWFHCISLTTALILKHV